jgi:cyclic pyranopterin phosphate synthase
LIDNFGRSFHYLRLSVDDACNFKCSYCLPNGFRKTTEEPTLSVEEIRRLASAFAALGFWKLRLTGGEPTVRKDILQITETCSPLFKKTALSTNGYRLAELAGPLKNAGLSAVNVSVDSMHREQFEKVTGRDMLEQVLAGVDASLSAGLTVKLNAVLLKGFDLAPFLEYAQTKPVAVRFIELMKTGDHPEFFEKNHVSAEAVLSSLEEQGWSEQTRREGDGPARRFVKGAAEVGLIAPYSKDFCSTCNRLRVTSRGALKLCLFSDGQASLRDLLQDDAQKDELQRRVRSLLGLKEQSHHLQEGLTGGARNFALMGG